MAPSTPSGLGPWCVGTRVVVRRRLASAGSGPSGGPVLTDVLGVLEEWAERTLTIRTEAGDAVVVARRDVVAGKPVPPRPAPRMRVPVAVAEARAIDCWQPVERVELGSWVLRASGGFSARGNSALVLGDPGVPWPAAIVRVVDFYIARRLPVWVQGMTGSAELDRLLGQGWVTARPGEADTSFQLAGVAAARRALRSLRVDDRPACAPGAGAAPTVALRAQLTDGWLADDARAMACRDAAAAVLQGSGPVCFAAVEAPEGRVVAKARGALSQDAESWLGITDVWVAPDHRRLGLAGAVLDALLGWAAEQGATTAFLQVREDNHPALALYRRLGFTPHHSYRYLRAPT